MWRGGGRAQADSAAVPRKTLDQQSEGRKARTHGAPVLACVLACMCACEGGLTNTNFDGPSCLLLSLGSLEAQNQFIASLQLLDKTFQECNLCINLTLLFPFSYPFCFCLSFWVYLFLSYLRMPLKAPRPPNLCAGISWAQINTKTLYSVKKRQTWNWS